MEEVYENYFLNRLKEYQKFSAAIKEEIEFRSGDTKGPYVAIRKSRICKIKRGCVGITMLDYTGEKYCLEISGQDPIPRILPCPNALLANCVLLLTGSENYMQILITKDIKKGEFLNAILVPEKRYPMHFQQQQLQQKIEADSDRKYYCEKCNLAKFSSLGNLKIHQEHYCSQRDMQKEQEEKMRKLKEEEQNIIQLQLALRQIQEKQAAFQLLNLSPGGLHPVLKSQMVSSFSHDASIISAAAAAVNAPNPFIIHQKSPVPPFPQMKVNIPVINLDDEDEKTAGESSSTPAEVGTPKLSDVPSTSTSSMTSSPGSSKIQTSRDPEKPFNCSCGVSFTNEQTFHAHQFYYCKNAISTMIQKHDISRKIPEKCQHCDFQPESSTQLSLHMRNCHQSANTFICTVCGYRAFSMRGIRTHMRSHPEEDALKFEACQSMAEKLRKTPLI